MAPPQPLPPQPYPTLSATPATPPGRTDRSNQWLIPVVVTVAVLLLAGIGVMIGLLARQNTGPAVDVTSPATGRTVPAQPPSHRPEPYRPAPLPAPARPAMPPAVTGPDSSARHESCDAGYSLTNASGFGTHAKRGSRATSCFFTQQVLIAYWNRYGNANGDARSVSAPGAVDCRSVGGNAACDDRDFVMRCATDGSDNWITCRGGNDAVVYLY